MAVRFISTHSKVVQELQVQLTWIVIFRGPVVGLTPFHQGTIWSSYRATTFPTIKNFRICLAQARSQVMAPSMTDTFQFECFTDAPYLVTSSAASSSTTYAILNSCILQCQADTGTLTFKWIHCTGLVSCCWKERSSRKWLSPQVNLDVCTLPVNSADNTYNFCQTVSGSGTDASVSIPPQPGPFQVSTPPRIDRRRLLTTWAPGRLWWRRQTLCCSQPAPPSSTTSTTRPRPTHALRRPPRRPRRRSPRRSPWSRSHPQPRPRRHRTSAPPSSARSVGRECTVRRPVPSQLAPCRGRLAVQLHWQQQRLPVRACRRRPARFLGGRRSRRPRCQLDLGSARSCMDWGGNLLQSAGRTRAPSWARAARPSCARPRSAAPTRRASASSTSTGRGATRSRAAWTRTAAARSSASRARWPPTAPGARPSSTCRPARTTSAPPAESSRCRATFLCFRSTSQRPTKAAKFPAWASPTLRSCHTTATLSHADLQHISHFMFQRAFLWSLVKILFNLCIFIEATLLNRKKIFYIISYWNLTNN